MINPCPKCGSNNISIYDDVDTYYDEIQKDTMINDSVIWYFCECEDCGYIDNPAQINKGLAIKQWNERPRNVGEYSFNAKREPNIIDDCEAHKRDILKNMGCL